MHFITLRDRLGLTSARRHVPWLFVLACFCSAHVPIRGEDGYELWLRYRLEPAPERRAEYRAIARSIVETSASAVIAAAGAELHRALAAITGAAPGRDGDVEGAIFLGKPGDAEVITALVLRAEIARCGPEGFVIRAGTWRNRRAIVIAGERDAGILHGAFRLLRHMQLGQSLDGLDVADTPRLPERIANHWDNPVRTNAGNNSSVERVYAGESIFHFEQLPGKIDSRLHDWARLLAAMGLNGVVINNVNTVKRGLEGWRLLTPEYLPKLGALAGVLRPYGVRLFISVSFVSPVIIDQLATSDPLDPTVKTWWRAKAGEIYAAIPDFGGFLIKADSEGEAGPGKLGRTHADGANLLADALAPHGGSVHWRAFRAASPAAAGAEGLAPRAKAKNPDFDRATESFDNFVPYDGKFRRNAFVQIKNGPVDFQVREPASPLLGALPRTNAIVELQITQEYTGHDRHLCFLAPMWREVLDFDTHARGPGSTVSRLLREPTHDTIRAGFAGVMNIGDARNWTGHLLAQANTYAFGRLAWSPDTSAESIADDWVRLTFGRQPRLVTVVKQLLLDSWRTYEDYTGPLGLTMVTRRGDHFEPAPAERVAFHRADGKGVGYDRTRATGSSFTGQFFEPWRSRYESVSDCPDNLLLFFHHVPYTHRLGSGQTVIQALYDRHFAAANRAAEFVREWESLRDLIDSERHAHVLARFRDQSVLAAQWRDTMNGYFYHLSRIDDDRGRPLPSWPLATSTESAPTK